MGNPGNDYIEALVEEYEESCRHNEDRRLCPTCARVDDVVRLSADLAAMTQRAEAAERERDEAIKRMTGIAQRALEGKP